MAGALGRDDDQVLFVVEIILSCCQGVTQEHTALVWMMAEVDVSKRNSQSFWGKCIAF